MIDFEKKRYYTPVPEDQKKKNKGSNSATHPFNRQNRSLPTMKKLRAKKETKY